MNRYNIRIKRTIIIEECHEVESLSDSDSDILDALDCPLITYSVTEQFGKGKVEVISVDEIPEAL